MQSAPADRHHRGRLFSPTSFGEAKEVGRLPGRDPAWSSGRTDWIASSASRRALRSAFDVDADVALQPASKARRSCCVIPTGETIQPSLPWGQAGSRPGSRPTSLASPREVGKRRRPYDGGPLRGLHAPPVPETGSVRNSLRSDSGRFFFRFRHWRRVAV